MKAEFMKTKEPANLEQLKKLGLEYWHLDADKWEEEGKLDAICKERGYNYKDFVDSKKMPDLPAKLPIFLEEHIHDDEEIRFFVDGSGYFDIRNGESGDKEDWIRISCEKGDMLVLPAGIYHRFVPDDKMFFHVMRMFIGEPIWTPYNRKETETDSRKARVEYVSHFLQSK
eukprot:TRINITY_DN6428_c0_g1_i1.p1 TRINITY_DN6428_c0_g1~~TRINITY_DN6428_c0_g1_i1.p1  ORF type:complete len:180 (-),score=59.33 TRINITY_DN6428_c0_g1_i1:167-679(-)